MLTVTGTNGCTSTDNAEVILDDEAPGATATGGTLTCTTTSIMLTGSGNGSFSWTGPNNFTSQDQNPTVSVAGTYVLTVTGANGCTSTDNADGVCGWHLCAHCDRRERLHQHRRSGGDP
ncbi:MAG: hypothetical protein IPG92_13500 [Flavobacteriales bacterium]|nr:hypothetical protein [Flavobacteriales bacterium]